MKNLWRGTAAIVLSGLLIAGGYDASPVKAEDKNKAGGQEAATENEEALFGTVDIAAVYSLHPMMQYYDQNLDLFIKPPKAGTTYKDFLNIIGTRKNDFQKAFEGHSSEVKRLREEIRVLNVEIGKLDVNKAVEALPINAKYDKMLQTASNDEARTPILQQRTEELKKVETKYNIELQNKNKKLSDLLDAYEKIQRTLLKVYYLTPEETAKKFEEINLEVKETIKMAAKKHGVKAVINLNAILPEDGKTAPAAKSVEEKMNANAALDDLLNSGPDYSKALGILMNFNEGFSQETIQTRNPQMSESDYLKAHNQARKDREKEAASKSFFSKDYVMKLKQIKHITSMPVICGSVDLTWYTIISIMVKNGIPKEKAEAISEVILKLHAPSANK